MVTKLNAATRLMSATTDWFESLTDEQKANYLEEHPESKFNKHKSVVTKKPLSSEDRRRITQLRSDIKTNEQDVRDFEADGDTEWVTKTQKIVDRSKVELKELLNRQ